MFNISKENFYLSKKIYISKENFYTFEGNHNTIGSSSQAKVTPFKFKHHKPHQLKFLHLYKTTIEVGKMSYQLDSEMVL
jgi:hypothetical protein